jgi:hypothetical protein
MVEKLRLREVNSFSQSYRAKKLRIKDLNPGLTPKSPHEPLWLMIPLGVRDDNVMLPKYTLMILISTRI